MYIAEFDIDAMDHRIGSSTEALCGSIKAAASSWSTKGTRRVLVSYGMGLRAGAKEEIRTPFRMIGPGRGRRVRP